MPEKRQKIYSVSSGYHLPTFCQQPNYLFLASTYSTCQEWIQWLPSLAAIPIALKMNKKTLMVRWATPPNYSSYLWTYITQDSLNIPSMSGCSTCSVLLSLWISMIMFNYKCCEFKFVLSALSSSPLMYLDKKCLKNFHKKKLTSRMTRPISWPHCKLHSYLQSSYLQSLTMLLTFISHLLTHLISPRWLRSNEHMRHVAQLMVFEKLLY